MTSANPPRYAYLGPAGTFTEAALRQVASPEEAVYLPQVDVVGAIEAVRSDDADFAVVAIENSVGGGVTATPDTLPPGPPLAPPGGVPPDPAPVAVGVKAPPSVPQVPTGRDAIAAYFVKDGKLIKVTRYKRLPSKADVPRGRLSVVPTGNLKGPTTTILQAEPPAYCHTRIVAAHHPASTDTPLPAPPTGSLCRFFAGPNAEGAGLVFSAGFGTGGTGVTGAVAFKR